MHGIYIRDCEISDLVLPTMVHPVYRHAVLLEVAGDLKVGSYGSARLFADSWGIVDMIIVSM